MDIREEKRLLKTKTINSAIERVIRDGITDPARVHVVNEALEANGFKPLARNTIQQRITEFKVANPDWKELRRRRRKPLSQAQCELATNDLLDILRRENKWTDFGKLYQLEHFQGKETLTYHQIRKLLENCGLVEWTNCLFGGKHWRIRKKSNDNVDVFVRLCGLLSGIKKYGLSGAFKGMDILGSFGSKNTTPEERRVANWIFEMFGWEPMPEERVKALSDKQAA